MLRLTENWLWDFWFAQDGADTHVFYLQAPRSLGDPDLRHWNVTIGHAVSQDLTHWQVLPDALAPSPVESGAWDNYSTWTGSVLKHGALWYLFYTGTSRVEKGKVQRVGLATSPDLIHWQKHPANPLIEADATYYERYDPESGLWWQEAWRDPCVFRHPDTGVFHAFITGRVNHGPADGRGVVAHARSTDLLHWEVLPPVTIPGDFGHLEVPQLVAINGRYYLLFCTAVNTFASDWQSRTGQEPVMGTHYLVGDNPLGPFHLSTPRFLSGDKVGSLYAGKMLQNAAGEWVFLAWRNMDEEGHFLGELSDPIPVQVESSGNLWLGESR